MEKTLDYRRADPELREEFDISRREEWSKYDKEWEALVGATDGTAAMAQEEVVEVEEEVDGGDYEEEVDAGND